jgi:restriction system protein
MARSGNASDWQARLAAQRQEQERLARERKEQQREKEKVRQKEYLESQQRDADEQTAAVQEQVKSLEEVLTSVLPLPPMSFDRLMATARTPPFDPGPLGVAAPDPDWSDFAPAKPTGLRRFLGGTDRFKRETAHAQRRFEAAAAEHRQRDSQRRQALATERAKYHQKVTEQRAEAAARNAFIAGRQLAFTAGEAESVEWFARCVLRASRYPDRFPREYQVAYDRQTRNVTVEFELPAQDVVPLIGGYRYVKARDVIEPVPHSEDEISRLYERLISGIALRTLHEIFSATAPEVVRAVSFAGYVSVTDQATGKPVRSQLLAVSAERPVFEDLVLAAVEPAACLARLNAEGAEEAERGGSAHRLELGVALGGLEQIKQGAERFEVGPGPLGQRRPVVGLEVAGHLVLPVPGRLLPGGAEHPDLLLAITVGPGQHGSPQPGRGGRLPGSRCRPAAGSRRAAGRCPAGPGTRWP